MNKLKLLSTATMYNPIKLMLLFVVFHIAAILLLAASHCLIEYIKKRRSVTTKGLIMAIITTGVAGIIVYMIAINSLFPLAKNIFNRYKQIAVMSENIENDEGIIDSYNKEYESIQHNIESKQAEVHKKYNEAQEKFEAAKQGNIFND